jgi:hypothetical protein
VDDVDADRASSSAFADARELEELRRVDRAAAEDHLAGATTSVPAVHDLDADRPRALEETRVTKRAAATSRFGRRRTGCRYARAALSAGPVDVPVERARSPPGARR